MSGARVPPTGPRPTGSFARDLVGQFFWASKYSSLLGLEVLIIGDIVRTIIVDPTVESVAVLAMIVIIRIVLSFSLEVEIDGVGPWNLWRIEPKTNREADPKR